MNTFLPIAFFNGKYLPFEEANLSIATHALHYGTGAFGGLRGVVPEGIKGKGIVLFRMDRHCARLSASARTLGVDFPASYFQEIITEFVKRNQPSANFYIRPLIYTSDLGIAPRLHSVAFDVAIFGLPLGDYLPPSGVSCRFSSWYRSEDRSVPGRGKITGSYITSSLAKTEAVLSGFEEAILLNSRGKVSEGSGMNIFIVRNGTLITPSVDQDILEGITRASIIELARHLNIPVEERAVDKGELIIADEVFLSGTAARITPVRKIEQYEIATPGPITSCLRDRLITITEGSDKEFSAWTTTITW